MGDAVTEIRPLDNQRDAEACDAVLRTLPYHFGDPDGQRQCAIDVRTHRGWVALDGREIVGFVTVAPQLDGDAVEVTWLAVRNDRRRAGIGGSLIDAAVDGARGAGARMLVVLTLGPSSPEPADAVDNYDGTRRFYRSHGFVPLKELSLADWNSAFALVLARPLAP